MVYGKTRSQSGGIQDPKQRRRRVTQKQDNKQQRRKETRNQSRDITSIELVPDPLDNESVSTFSATEQELSDSEDDLNEKTTANDEANNEESDSLSTRKRKEHDDAVSEKLATVQKRQRMQRDVLMKVYDSGMGVKEDKQVLRDLKCVVRDFIVPNVKFVDTRRDSTFPSFLKHDFSDEKHFITTLVNDGCGMREKTTEEKAKFWLSYGKVVKKEFANHRSFAAATMKAEFLRCEYCLQVDTCVRKNETNNVMLFTNCIKIQYSVMDEYQKAGGIPTSVQKVLNLAKTKKVEELREVVDNDGFQFFAEVCLKSVVKRREWRQNHRRQNLSEFVTKADKSLALLVLENNIYGWMDKVEGKVNTTSDVEVEGDAQTSKKRIRLRTEYTDGGKTRGIKKGWSGEGIKRYNKIMTKVGMLRKDVDRVNSLEDEVRSRWRAIGITDTKGKDNDDENSTDEEVEEALTEFDFGTELVMV